jgi:hypothetical protein
MEEPQILSTPSRPDSAARLLAWAPVLVFAIVLTVRALLWAQLEASPLSQWHLWMETDEWGYLDWSDHLASGNWLDRPAWRSYFVWQEPYGPPESWERWYRKDAYFAGPLYPYSLALIRRCGLPLVASARFLQLLLACAAAASVAAAVRAIGRRKGGGEGSWALAAAALAAGLFHGLEGALAMHDGFTYRDGPVVHLSALLIALAILARRESGEPRRGEWLALALGLLGGAAVLLKQTILPLALAAAWAGVAGAPDRTGRRRRAVVSLLGLALPIGALAARNLAVGVPPLTFDTRQAIGLAWGNGRGADATTTPPPTMKEILDRAEGSTAKTARLVLEGYSDAPLAFPLLLAKKGATFFLAYEVPDNTNWYLFRDRIPLLRALPTFPGLFGIGLVGLALLAGSGRLRRGEGLLLGVAFLTPLAACLAVQTTSRYRVGAVPPLALGAGFLVLFLVDAAKRRATGAILLAVASAAALAVTSAFAPSPIPTPRHRWPDTLVVATLAESWGGAEAGAAEIRRYLAEGADDRDRERGLRACALWASGRREPARVAPGGVAPVGRRYSDGIGAIIPPRTPGMPAGADFIAAPSR